MAWQTLQFRLTSACPMLMHNGQTADPMNKFSKLMKEISSKRAKTEADYIRMAEIEFKAGLYMSPDGPILPSYLIDAVLINSAKKSKEGQAAKSGVFANKHAVLEYDGPRTAEELWMDENFRHVAICRIQNARIARTRPTFKQWASVIDINVEPSVINPSRIIDWLVIGGTLIGVGDWRPQFGRFTVESVK